MVQRCESEKIVRVKATGLGEEPDFSLDDGVAGAFRRGGVLAVKWGSW
jgi:hypothetical protein